MLELTPAYTDYKSKKEVEAALKANKDFIIQNWDHPYCGAACNAQDLRAEGHKQVLIRYKRLRSIAPFKVPAQ